MSEIFSEQLKLKLPMYATYSRMLLMPPIVYIMYTNPSPYSPWIATILFIIASITDWLDGYLARLFNAESAMGKFMDPIADKILVLGALVILLQLGRVDPFMVLLLLGRDIFIGGIRSVAAANNVIIAAKPFGKWKTGVQMMSIPCLILYQPVFDLPLGTIGYYGLWISVILSLVSGFQYTFGYYKGVKP